jgi:alpha-glucosidase
MEGHGWWRDAVVYQVYPRSWADSDGDGIGDLPGITARLDHLVTLGVDALWLSPFYVSPQNDGGYDVADHRDVDPLFGDLAAFDALLARAHELGLRVIVDVVPNHTSSDHPWFREAIADGLGSPARARYLFRDGRGPDGAEPPNNWTSNFGGPAWTRVPDGQWYLHLFDVTQPDLDWSNPEVGDEYESVLRFWLERGVDGFRIDVAHGMVKADGLPDTTGPWDSSVDPTGSQPMWDQPGVHEIHRRWRRVVDEYDDRILCAEAWVLPDDALARYVRADELHQSFNFAYLMTPWIAADLRHTISATLAAAEAVGAPQTWVLSNHDVVRHASRFGLPQISGRPSRVPGIGPDDPQPDAALGLRRGRAATTVMLALPGSAYLYQGEELGLPEATRLPDDALRDPTWERSRHRSRGRDGCRVPMPWDGAAPSLGFGPGDHPWLPQPAGYADLAVDRQDGDVASTLELYRRLLRLRRDLRPGLGRLVWRETPDDVLGLDVELPGGGTLTVLANLGTSEYALPDGLEVIVTSDGSKARGSLAPDTAVWTRPVAR